VEACRRLSELDQGFEDQEGISVKEDVQLAR